MSEKAAESFFTVTTQFGGGGSYSTSWALIGGRTWVESAHGFDLDFSVRFFQGTGNMHIFKKRDESKKKKVQIFCAMF